MAETKLIQLTRKRRCDFCGKHQDQVAVLIAAPEGAADICDDCVGVCVEVLAEHKKAKAEEAGKGKA